MAQINEDSRCVKPHFTYSPDSHPRYTPTNNPALGEIEQVAVDASAADAPDGEGEGEGIPSCEDDVPAGGAESAEGSEGGGEAPAGDPTGNPEGAAEEGDAADAAPTSS